MIVRTTIHIRRSSAGRTHERRHVLVRDVYEGLGLSRRNDKIESPRRMPTLIPRLRSLVAAVFNTVSRSTINNAQNAGTNLKTRAILNM
jgi:hypothetical protein